RLVIAGMVESARQGKIAHSEFEDISGGVSREILDRKADLDERLLDTPPFDQGNLDRSIIQDPANDLLDGPIVGDLDHQYRIVRAEHETPAFTVKFQAAVPVYIVTQVDQHIARDVVLREFAE